MTFEDINKGTMFAFENSMDVNIKVNDRSYRAFDRNERVIVRTVRAPITIDVLKIRVK